MLDPASSTLCLSFHSLTCYHLPPLLCCPAGCWPAQNAARATDVPAAVFERCTALAVENDALQRRLAAQRREGAATRAALAAANALLSAASGAELARQAAAYEAAARAVVRQRQTAEDLASIRCVPACSLVCACVLTHLCVCMSACGMATL